MYTLLQCPAWDVLRSSRSRRALEQREQDVRIHVQALLLGLITRNCSRRALSSANGMGCWLVAATSTCSRPATSDTSSSASAPAFSMTCAAHGRKLKLTAGFSLSRGINVDMQEGLLKRAVARTVHTRKFSLR